MLLKSDLKFKIKFFLITFFLISAVINIASSLEILPFSSIGKIFAARTAPNSSQIVSMLGGYSLDKDDTVKYFDTADQCEIIDPNVGTYKVGEANSRRILGLSGTLGGVNQGINNLDFQYEPDLSQPLFDITADDLGMSFVLAITTKFNDQTVASTATFIDEANESGLVPIIRLCYVGNCDPQFKDPGNVAAFYQKVYLASSGEFVAMLGPNEPYSNDFGSGAFEYENFGNTPLEAIQNAQKAAEQLQDIRNDRVFLSPGSINITRGSDGQGLGFDSEVALFKSGISNPELFDVLMTNAYELSNTTTTIYDYYVSDNFGQSLQGWASETGLQVIFTEFGIFRNPRDAGIRSEDQLLSDARSSSLKLCADENVVGALFFRSLSAADFPNTRVVTENQMDNIHTISVGNLKGIIGNCEKDFGKGGRSMRELAWASCNFDSVIYAKDHDPKSVASACAYEDPVTLNNRQDGAALKIECSGNACTVKKRYTVEVAMPIKQFASTLPGGTKNYNYPAVCAELAKSVSFSDQDPINQFAGELTAAAGDSTSYPMPWLGSGLNCASELIKALPDYASLYPVYEPSLGSSISESVLEKSNEANLAKELINGTKAIDEKTICFGKTLQDSTGQCMSIASAISASLAFRPYQPSRVSLNYTQPENDNACYTGDIVIREERSDYIIGPEKYISEEQVVAEPFGGDVCIAYATRSSADENSPYSFDTFLPNDPADPPVVCEPVAQSSLDTNASATCRAYYNVLASCFSPQIEGDLKSAQANEGSCAGLSSAMASCLAITRDEGAYWMDTAYPQIPEYDIPEAYDAVYEMYSKTQSRLSANNLTFIARENFGMDSRVSVKTRDVNKTNSINAGAYGYRNASENTAGVLLDSLFNNEYWLAKENAIRTKTYYYDFLGYLNYLQEINYAYIQNSTGTAPLRLNYNPLSDIGTQVENFPEELVEKDYFLTSGSSNFMNREPFMTCDDVKLLEAELNISNGITDYKSPEWTDLNINCITYRNEAYYTQQDSLANYLCSRGYKLENRCEDLFCRIEEVPVENKDFDIKQISTQDGLIATIPSNADFIAREYSSLTNIEQFTNDTDSFIAINGPQRNDAIQGGAPEGLVASNGVVKYNRTSTGMTHAFIFHDGSITKNINVIDHSGYEYSGAGNDPQIITGTDRFAISYINNWAEEPDSQIASYVDYFSGKSDIIVSGGALIIADGIPVSLNKVEFADNPRVESSPRTLIGWDNNNNFVAVILNAANMTEMINFATSNNINTLLMLDGGGSSQMYVEEGLAEITQIPNVDRIRDAVKSKVYWPGGVDTNAPRPRDWFLGIQSIPSTETLQKEVCYNECSTSISNPGDNRNPINLSNASCPVKGNITCSQGPLGEATHYCSAGGRIAFDFTGGDYKIYAPEDGYVRAVVGWDQETASGENSCGGTPSIESIVERTMPAYYGISYLGAPSSVTQSAIDQAKLGITKAEYDSTYNEIISDIESLGGVGDMRVKSTGGNIYFVGNSGIEYWFVHVGVSSAQAQGLVNKKFVGGDAITDSNGSPITLYKKDVNLAIPCYGGPHLHFENSFTGLQGKAGITGRYENPYDFVGDVLGCGEVVNECRFDNNDKSVQCEIPWENNNNNNNSNVCTPYGGGQNPTSNKTFKSLNDLIEAVSQSVGNSFGVYFPPEMLKAMLTIESGLDEPFENSSDPLAFSPKGENSVGALGPAQIIRSTFEYLVSTRSTELNECLDAIGVDIAINLEMRAYLGPAMCLGAILQIHNTQAFLGSSTFSQLNNRDNWYNINLPSDTGMYFAFDDVDYTMNPLMLAARKYYGACKDPSIGGKETCNNSCDPNDNVNDCGILACSVSQGNVCRRASSPEDSSCSYDYCRSTQNIAISLRSEFN